MNQFNHPDNIVSSVKCDYTSYIQPDSTFDYNHPASMNHPESIVCPPIYASVNKNQRNLPLLLVANLRLTKPPSDQRSIEISGQIGPSEKYGAVGGTAVAIKYDTVGESARVIVGENSKGSEKTISAPARFGQPLVVDTNLGKPISSSPKVGQPLVMECSSYATALPKVGKLLVYDKGDSLYHEIDGNKEEFYDDDPMYVSVRDK